MALLPPLSQRISKQCTRHCMVKIMKSCRRLILCDVAELWWVVDVIGETIVAIKLASADNWKQLWTDATTLRRQIPFTALVIGLLGDEETIDPVVVSSCIFMKDEKSDTQVDGILEKIGSLKSRLEQLKSVVQEKCPTKLNLIPSPD